jgi:hypothetical protein
MKKTLSIIFFLTVWLTCQSQNIPFSLVSPSFQDEPLVMLDQQNEFLFEMPYQHTGEGQILFSDKVEYQNNGIAIQIGGGFEMCLTFTSDCQWIASYDLFLNHNWQEGFVFVIAEDVIMLNSKEDE